MVYMSLERVTLFLYLFIFSLSKSCFGLSCIQCKKRSIICEKYKPKDCSLQKHPSSDVDGEFVGCGIEIEEFRQKIANPRYICVGKYRLECYRKEFNVHVQEGLCEWQEHIKTSDFSEPLLPKFSDSECIKKKARYVTRSLELLNSSDEEDATVDGRHLELAGVDGLLLGDHEDRRKRRKKRHVPPLSYRHNARNVKNESHIKICFCQEDGCNHISNLEKPIWKSASVSNTSKIYYMLLFGFAMSILMF